MTLPIPNLQDWHFKIDHEQIAWATLDRQGESQNSLSRRVLEELGQITQAVAAAAATKSVRGLVILSGKDKGFIVGADVREFELLKSEQDVIDNIKTVNGMLDAIERLTVPVVVGMHGFCLGGGLELALACHWRIATKDEATRFGFPEVKLGLFPGFNGTARFLRQSGALAAMPAMLAGNMIRSGAAYGMGLVDELVDTPGQLRWAARRAIEKGRRSTGVTGFKALLSKWPLRGHVAKRMRAETAKKAIEAHYPAPFRLIDLFDAHGGNIERMKAEETLAFAPLMMSPTSKNLRRVFRLSELLKAQAPKDLTWTPLRVHVIGAGVMGADIAGWCVASGMEVTLQDLSPDAITKGIEAQGKLLARKFKTKAQRDAAKARLIADPNGNGIGRADVVIEAIVERVDIKQKLFADIEARLKPGAVMATNTSSIMIEAIAKDLRDPGRLIGIHFFNPVAAMPLVEIVCGRDSRKAEVDKGCAFVAAIDKFPLVVKSAPGFVVNRVLGPYMMAAMERLEKGEKKEVIDEAARAFGMPMGPIELADQVGLDVCANVGKVLGRSAEGSKLAALVEGKKLGKKSGEGFYVWKDGKPVKAAVTADRETLQSLGRELVEPLIRECEKVRDEKIVDSADLVDAGVIFGTGFAPFRGGPLHFRAYEPKSNVTPLRPVQAAE
jgi:3-hydroxyacyl-CoA dehydrogenase / enoyl-CoA hydratase / 3-hydroxybutyryl-CoA epimerase